MQRKYAAVSLVLLVAAALILLGAQPKQTPAANTASAVKPSNLPSQQTVESFLKKWFGYDSSMQFAVAAIRPSEDPNLAEVMVRVTNAQGQQQALRLFISPDGKHAIAGGEMLPFGANPFEPIMDKLKSGLNGATRGPADAPVLIVEFGDLECPSCKNAQPTVDKMLNDNPAVHFVFQQFPLVQIHPWAYKASTYAQCVTKQNNDAFWKFQAAIYADQENINPQNADAKLTAAATQAGVNGAEIAKCAALPETAKQVDASLKLGQAVNVTGTPTVFINGRHIANIAAVPPDTLNNLIKFAPQQVGQ